MADHPPVTIGAPLMPDRQRLFALLDEAMDNGWLTNCALLHNRLEAQLKHWLGGVEVSLLSSGTMALMMALRLGDLRPGAEVITSPLSFPATVQAIEWCGFKPVFADVEPDYLTLDPQAVEAAISPRTAAILPVHLLGVPCDLGALADVAGKHGLWLAYDAAHAFGVKVHGRSIAEYGDASAFSLHATKLLHTAEGGFLCSPHADAAERARTMRNFGIEAGRMTGPGINGKLSELHAAMGLALIEELPREIAARDALRRAYDTIFEAVPGMRPHPGRVEARASLTFYGVRAEPRLRARFHGALARENIAARDHFPLLCGAGTAFPQAVIVTADGEAVAPRQGCELLCLPFHGGVTEADVGRIARIARQCATEDEGTR